MGWVSETEIYTVFLIIKVVQELLLIFCFILFVSYANILMSTGIYHRNLCTLLVALSFQQLMVVVPFSVLDLKWSLGYYDPQTDVIVLFLHNVGVFGFVFNIPMLAIERIFAYYYVERYEHMNKVIPWTSIFLIGIQIFFSIGFVICVHLESFDEISTFVITFSSFAIGSLVFSIIPALTKRAFSLIRKKGGTVSKRYQSTENLRASKMLMKLAIYVISVTTAQLTFYYIHYFILPEYLNSELQQQISASLLVYMWQADFIATAFIILRSHRSLYLKFREGLPSCCNRILKQSKVTSMVTSTDGKQLEFKPEDQKKMYFKAYESMWK